jgi:hypothetical protein
MVDKLDIEEEEQPESVGSRITPVVPISPWVLDREAPRPLQCEVAPSEPPAHEETTASSLESEYPLPLLRPRWTFAKVLFGVVACVVAAVLVYEIVIVDMLRADESKAQETELSARP